MAEEFSKLIKHKNSWIEEALQTQSRINKKKSSSKHIRVKDAWMARLVKRPTLGFGSGHDLRVVRSSPVSGSMLSTESA